MGEVIDGGTQDITGDTLRFTSTVAETLTLSANVIDVERVEIATAAGDPTGLATINVNAAAVTSNGMTLVGNNGANQITGTAFADTLTGNVGNDTLNGMAGNDTLKAARAPTPCKGALVTTSSCWLPLPSLPWARSSTGGMTPTRCAMSAMLRTRSR